MALPPGTEDAGAAGAADAHEALVEFEEAPRETGRPSEEVQQERVAIGAARGRERVRALETEGQAIEARLDEIRKQFPTGHLKIVRTGPSDIPQSERGSVGRIKWTEVANTTVDEVIERKWGGGEYQAIAMRNMREALPGALFDIEVAGTIKPKSVDGEIYVQRRSGQVKGPTAGESALTAKVDELLTTLRDQRGGAPSGQIEMLVMLQRFETESRAQRKLDEEEYARRRSVEQEERERRAEEREAERGERTERLKQADIRAAKELEESRQRHEVALADSEKRFQLQMEKERADRDARLREIELKTTGGVGGFDMMKQLRTRIGDLFMDKVEADIEGATGAAAGDAPDDWGAVVRKVAADHGGELLHRVLDVFAEKKGVAPPPRRSLPAPVAASAPATSPLAAGADVSSSPAAASPDGASTGATTQSAPTETTTSTAESAAPVASPQEAFKVMATAATQKVQGRILGFLRAIGSEMLAQSDPAAAWNAPQDEDGVTLADVYDLLPSDLRTALESGWPNFVKALPASARAEAEALERTAEKFPVGRAWLTDFVAEGPWNDEEETPDVDTSSPTGDDDEPPAGGATSGT